MHGKGGVEVVAVGSDKPEARALRRAAAAGVPTRVFEPPASRRARARDAAIADWLEEREVELVVLAGYMQLLDPAFLARFPQRVVNVHPTLLPAFPGIGSIEQAIAYGVKVAGVTVHFVDEGVDTGAIIAQKAIPVPEGADAPRCARRCARSSTSSCRPSWRRSRAAPSRSIPAIRATSAWRRVRER